MIDRRESVKGPGLHALVIGVGAYPYLPENAGPRLHGGRDTFGLGQLSSAATAACCFVNSLYSPPLGAVLGRPLKTCRLLLLPHADELPLVNTVLKSFGKNTVPAGTIDDVIAACSDWRKDAEADGPDAMTVFYFSGHGVQVERGRNASMLLADFPPYEGGAAMSKALHLSNLEGFMHGSASHQGATPRNQYYFIDACRTEPDDLAIQSKTAVHSEHPHLKQVQNMSLRDRRLIARFFAARSGALGWGRGGVGTYFGKALRLALSWAGTRYNEPVAGLNGTTVVVSPESLQRGLRHEFVAIVEQEIAAGHLRVDDVIDEFGEIGLPDGPGDVDPIRIVPLFTLSTVPECRVWFSISPPKRGTSQAYGDFCVGQVQDQYGQTLLSEILGNLPRFMSSQHLSYRARVWNDASVRQTGGAPVLERVGVLARPADKVIVETTQ